MDVEVDWRGDFTVPLDVEPLAQSVLAEALRNISKHADPTRVEVAVARDAGTFKLEVRNDGAGARNSASGGIGLRLAAFEALQHGGTVESGRVGDDGFRVALLVPLEESR
jgi:signal transduction histidine kinase